LGILIEIQCPTASHDLSFGIPIFWERGIASFPNPLSIPSGKPSITLVALKCVKGAIAGFSPKPAKITKQ
jgi:hypothetical protein